MVEKKVFWKSLPGVLTGVAAVMTAGTGVYLATHPRVGPLGTLVPTSPLGARPLDNNATNSSTAGTSPQTNVSDWPLVARELFSDSTPAWWIGAYSDEHLDRFNLDFSGNKYRWDVAFRDDWQRLIQSPYGAVTNFYAAADFVVSSRQGDYVNVGLGFGDANKQHYEFLLSSKGYFCLTRTTGIDNNIVLDWTPIRVVLEHLVKMAVVVDMGQMAFYVNDNLVGNYHDPVFSGGNIGLVVGGPAGSKVTVDVDNFELRRKPGG